MQVTLQLLEWSDNKNRFAQLHFIYVFVRKWSKHKHPLIITVESHGFISIFHLKREENKLFLTLQLVKAAIYTLKCYFLWLQYKTRLLIPNYPDVLHPFCCHITMSPQTANALLQPDTLNLHDSMHSPTPSSLISPLLTFLISPLCTPSGRPHPSLPTIPSAQGPLCQHMAQCQPVSHPTPWTTYELLRTLLKSIDGSHLGWLAL